MSTPEQPPRDLAMVAAEAELEDKRGANRSKGIGLGLVAAVILGMIGLNVYGVALRNSSGNNAAVARQALAAVEHLTAVSEGQAATIRRLEAGQDSADALAACRSDLNAVAQIATLGALLFVLPDPDAPQLTDDQRLAGLAALRRQVQEAYTARVGALGDADGACEAVPDPTTAPPGSTP